MKLITLLRDTRPPSQYIFGYNTGNANIELRTYPSNKDNIIRRPCDAHWQKQKYAHVNTLYWQYPRNSADTMERDTFCYQLGGTLVPSPPRYHSPSISPPTTNHRGCGIDALCIFIIASYQFSPFDLSGTRVFFICPCYLFSGPQVRA